VVLNASSGICSKFLSLRGPLSTLTTGPGSGLAAIALAAELLSTRDDVTWMVAGGVDERSACESSGSNGLGSEGAACLLLGNSEGPDRVAEVGQIRLAGWGVAGPKRLSDAIERARAGARSAPKGTELHFREEDWCEAGPIGEEAAASALACAAAVLALRRGEASRALVSSDRGQSASVAVLLTN
jgi:hypothetical protein